MCRTKAYADRGGKKILPSLIKKKTYKLCDEKEGKKIDNVDFEYLSNRASFIDYGKPCMLEYARDL